MRLRWISFGRRPRLRYALYGAAGFVGVSLVGGLLFAWSGLYNVAASSEHLAITRALLAFGLHSSVRTHSLGIKPPPLDDPELVRLGAGHFEGGCAPCHGAPGKPNNPIFEGMLPPPPATLSHAVNDWEDEELFWIVKHGLKYTAMPAWPALQRDDEVWAVTAFLRRLPDLSAEEYRSVVDGAAVDEDKELEFATFEALAECARCHGDRNASPASRLIPKLAGQPVTYLRSALTAYAEGARFSGVMQPVAATLDANAIERVAEYYAGGDQQSRKASQDRAAPEDLERGRRIATAGAPEDGLPACVACHGEEANPIFPRLAGQHAPYVLGQLKLFKQGKRGLTATSAIMEAIAKRLSEAQMEVVAAYYESLDTSASVSALPANASDAKAAP